jgi:hypothetical protein
MLIAGLSKCPRQHRAGVIRSAVELQDDAAPLLDRRTGSCDGSYSVGGIEAKEEPTRIVPGPRCGRMEPI